MKLHLGKIIGWTVSILVIALAAFIYIRFYYVFGDGVREPGRYPVQRR